MNTTATPPSQKPGPPPSLKIPEIVATSPNGTTTPLTPLSDEAIFMPGSTLSEISVSRKSKSRQAYIYDLPKSPIQSENEKQLPSKNDQKSGTDQMTANGESKDTHIETKGAEKLIDSMLHFKNESQTFTASHTPNPSLTSLFSPFKTFPSPNQSPYSSESDLEITRSSSIAFSEPWDWDVKSSSEECRERARSLDLWENMLANEKLAAECVRSVYGDELEERGLVRDREVVEWYVERERSEQKGEEGDGNMC